MTTFVVDADAKGWKFQRTPGAKHFEVRDDGDDSQVGTPDEYPADATPCTDCGQPTYLRDPAGKPRHRVDCTAVTV